jgi:hypothetical protein
MFAMEFIARSVAHENTQVAFDTLTRLDSAVITPWNCLGDKTV